MQQFIMALCLAWSNHQVLCTLQVDGQISLACLVLHQEICPSTHKLATAHHLAGQPPPPPCSAGANTSCTVLPAQACLVLIVSQHAG